MKIGFDNDKYLSMQSEHIKERIGQFGDKLYLIIIKLPVRKFSSYRKRQTLLLSVLALIRRIIQN